MNQTLRMSLIALTVVLVVLALLIVGAFIGRQWFAPTADRFGPLMGQGMDWQRELSAGRIGPDMMRSASDQWANPYGPGMMGGGMMGGGMMGSFSTNSLYGVQPLSVEEAEQSVQDYLNALGDENLELAEIMVFDNHAYAQIIEKSTGRGAMEVLVDPVTGAVFPEFGPNMMWNVKYSPMAAGGMMAGFDYSGGGYGMGGMMGSRADEISEEMAISEETAVEIAQRYLDTYLAGTEADEHADPFYGYYTIHIKRDGETVGMLSVNDSSRAVWLHSWHGNLIQMSGE